MCVFIWIADILFPSRKWTLSNWEPFAPLQCSAEARSECSAVAALLLAYGEGDWGNAWLWSVCAADKWTWKKHCSGETCCSAQSICLTTRECHQMKKNRDGGNTRDLTTDGVGVGLGGWQRWRGYQIFTAGIYRCAACCEVAAKEREREGVLRLGHPPNGAHLCCLMLPYNPAESDIQPVQASPASETHTRTHLHKWINVHLNLEVWE